MKARFTNFTTTLITGAIALVIAMGCTTRKNPEPKPAATIKTEEKPAAKTAIRIAA